MRVDRQKLKKTILEVLSEAQQPTGAQAAMTPSAADPSTGKVGTPGSTGEGFIARY